MIPLREGIVEELVIAAGGDVRGEGDKVSIRCVLHEDTVASAFIVCSKNIYGCSACTGGRGWSAKKFCEALGFNWMAFVRGIYPSTPAPRPNRAEKPKPTFTPEQARGVWTAASSRARDDEFAKIDAPAHEYVAGRGLADARERGLYGIVGPGMHLPGSVARWPGWACRVVAALYDASGHVASIQGRKIDGSDKRTLFPEGSKPSGTVFANDHGRSLLAGTLSPSDPVVFGEGLTDFLGLSIAVDVAVLCVPGTGFAVNAIGSWAYGRTVLVALDCDQAARIVLDDTTSAMYRAGAARVFRVRWPKPCKDACDVIGLHGSA